MYQCRSKELYQPGVPKVRIVINSICTCCFIFIHFLNPLSHVVFQSLTISRIPNLGAVLENKWNGILHELEGAGDRSMKIGIGLPAMPHDTSGKYEKMIDMILSICEKHDCFFIEQMPYDKPKLLKYAKGKVNETKIMEFKEGVEKWFEFVQGLDIVVSARIHDGMVGISNAIPTIIIPTDYRILELIYAMELPYVALEDVVGTEFHSLIELMAATKADFKEFERIRRNHIKSCKNILESVGIEMDATLVNIIMTETL